MFSFRIQKIGVLNTENRYILNLISSRKFVQLSSISGAYALADHDDGFLKRKWIVIEERSFVDGEEWLTLFTCDCPDGHAQKERLDSIDPLIENESLKEFQLREEAQYCSHCVAVKSLRQNPIRNPKRAKAEVICSQPFAAVANAGSQGLGVIVAGHHQFKCQTCKQPNCVHLETFAQGNGEETGSDEDDLSRAFSKIKLSRETREDRFTCVSSVGIPWPVTDQYKQRKDEIANSGFPKKLIPSLTKTKCPHAFQYRQTQVRSDALIHREGHVQQVSLFNYTVKGKCKCSIPYDGQNDLLFNLDNKNLFDLEWLFSILDRTNCSSCPIMTAYKTAVLTRSRSNSAETLSYEQLRQAYNSFIRLLHWDQTAAFTCSACETALKNGDIIDIVCDGIAMGCKRYYFQDVIMPNPENTTPIKGTKYSER